MSRAVVGRRRQFKKTAGHRIAGVRGDAEESLRVVDEMVVALYQLSSSDDEELREAAETTLARQPGVPVD